MVEETRKYVDRRALEGADKARETEKPRPMKKEGRSAFDEFLEQNRRLQEGVPGLKPKSQNTATQKAVESSEKFREKFREQAREEKKEERTKEKTAEEKRETQGGEKKVVGKGSLKREQGSSGGSREGDTQGGMARKGKQGKMRLEKGAKNISRPESGSHEFAKAFQTKLSQHSATLPRELPPEVVRQIIRHVRLGRNRLGEAEIDLDLHQEIFRGLRLRVGLNRGKVTIHFLTATEETRELFAREESSLRRTLEQKGIAVETIRVT